MAALHLDEQAIFEVARKIDSREAREAYLQETCGDDAAIGQRVRALLKANEVSASFLEAPVVPLVGTVDEPIRERPGTVIGPYKLLQEIGEGGMGVVFMAEQTHPVQRKVALKIIKPGMDSRQVIARFEAERQALALMDHPNIAKVLDAGTSEAGRPYFVMELVKGVPITKYCDEHHLTPRERLELFVPVCQAIQHAHQKGVIHRDLKPSNVLVALYDGKPVPRVIDFGVAKATGPKLTEMTLFTQYGQIVGTLEYMSPEQAELSQLDIDTRSDIYSLGVLLYELLTGTTPFARKRLREAAFDEMLRIIREEEPPKPSTRLSSTEELPSIAANRHMEPGKLTKLMRGELDWIVMKALEKDRNRRYESASAFAADVQRYLSDEPVLAGPPGAGYWLRKFLKRHRGPALAAALVLLALVGGMVGTTWGLVLVERANEDLGRALADERASMYRYRIGLAYHEWLANNVARAEQLLYECPADLRCWEWRYLKQVGTSTELTMRVCPGKVTSVACSPDGRRLASASWDAGEDGEGTGQIQFWDALSGRRLLTLPGPRYVGSLAFSPDGQQLAVGDSEGVVHILETAGGQEVQTLRGHTRDVYSVRFSPDGQWLASGGHDRTVRIWNAVTGRQIHTLRQHQSLVYSVAFSPDGRRLASASQDKAIFLYDVATGQVVTTSKGHTDAVCTVAFICDGRRLASAGADGTAKVWDATTGGHIQTIPIDTIAQNGVAFSPDGDRVACASLDKTVSVLDLRTGRELHRLRGHTGHVGRVVFSPDGQRLVCAGTLAEDTGRLVSTIKVWEALRDQQSHTLRGHRLQVLSVAFRPDGRRLASASEDQMVRVWDLASGKEVWKLDLHAGPVFSVAFSPDGKYLVCGTGWANPPALQRVLAKRVWDRRFGVKGEIKVFDAETGRVLRTLSAHEGEVSGLSFSCEGRLASASADGTVKLWDVKAGKELLILRGHTDRVTGVAFNPDGKRLASAGADSTVRLWDAESGHELRTLHGPRGEFTSVMFSPNGQRLAASGGPNGVTVWDAKDGREVFTARMPPGSVHGVAFTPDSRRLAATGPVIRLWDATTGHEVLTLPLRIRSTVDATLDVTFAPAGHQLAVANCDGTVSLWDATPWDTAFDRLTETVK